MDEGTSTEEEIADLCGFNLNGSSFRTRYFIDERTMTITPCAELGLTMAQSVPLLFFTVVNFCLVSTGFPRFSLKSVSTIFTLRIIVCLFTAFSFLSAVIISLASKFVLKEIILIEYGIIGMIWFTFSTLWILSLRWKSWTRTCGLTTSQFFASKVFHIITVNRWIAYGLHDPRTYIPFAVSICHLVNVVANIVEWRLYRGSQRHVPLDDYIHLNEDADEGSSWLSRIFFVWTNELVRKGGKRQLNSLNDIFQLPPSLQTATIERELVENSPTYYSDAQSYSIGKSLLATFGAQYFILAVPRMLSDLFTFAGPICLHYLVLAIDDPIPNNESLIFAGLMVLCTFMAALLSSCFSYYVNKVSIRVRSATVTAIYDKLLKVPMSETSRFSSGQILNFISTDVDRIVNFCNSFHAFWSMPVQLIIALYLLYREIGPSFLAGVVAAIVLIPINKVITSQIGKMSEKLMSCKDQRIKQCTHFSMITETMEGIRTVKMSAWEDFFEKKIDQLREKELHYLKMRKFLDAICVYLWASAPLLITISILSTYTLFFHEKLTAAKVFTSLALVNILIVPLNAFPWVLNGLVEAVVSLKRLEWFFAFKNMDLHEVYSLTRDASCALSVREGNFFWRGSNNAVSGVSFRGNVGSIVGISGDVGSGKSSLLLGLLGETNSLTEMIGITQESVRDGIGYLGQDRWLSRGTIRDNILAGKVYDEMSYNKVLKATCLHKDIQLFPGGDEYVISDNGSTLSGGQRTRVALARAIYQDNLVYLLDEPFASLDRKVADTIWTEVIEVLKKRGKLVIVASHDVRLLSRADDVIVLGKDGKVVKKGSAAEVLDIIVGSMSSDAVEDADCDALERVLDQDEEKQTGAVRADVYGIYGAATGICLSALIVAALATMQGSKNAADWWLSRWTESQDFNVSLSDSDGQQEPESIKQYLYGPRVPLYLSDSGMERSLRFLEIYAAIAVFNTVFTLVRAFLFAYGGVVAARNLHTRLLKLLLKAPISWWDRTPAGRVINRLCADVYTVDDNLPFQLNIFLASIFNLVGALVVSLMGLPLLAPVVLILFLVYFFIQKYYRLTTVELKRLSSLTLSPFYSHLKDTVNGLVTIRAQRFTDRWTCGLRARLTATQRAAFSMLAASQWLSIRLSLMAVTVVAAISVFAILQHRLTGVDSGLVGLAFTYALSLTGLLNALLGSFIETEKEMVSVERIGEYLDDVPIEEDNGSIKLPKDVNGRLDFASVSLKYARGLPLAIENVSLRVEAGQRVALIGRTGSGKSSLFQALLRTVPIESGRVLIDGVDISALGLRQLRTVVGIVPQHPFIFSGSLMDNMSVHNEKVDRNTVAHLVRVAHLDSLLARIGGLDGEIEEGGGNLSFGEKQLIAICRIIIAKPRVVLIDEATAHLDAASHKRMTSLLCVHLPMTTVVSIVHILTGLDDYDMVIEMDRGRIVYQGPPKESQTDNETESRA